MNITAIKAFSLGNCPLSPFREKKINLCLASLGLHMLLTVLKWVYSFEFSHRCLKAFLEINPPSEDEDSPPLLEVTVVGRRRSEKKTTSGLGVEAGALNLMGKEVKDSSCLRGKPSEPLPSTHTAERSLGAASAHFLHLERWV